MDRYSFHIIKFLLLVLLFYTHAVMGQTQYDLNDPRNPNCPCHKYQKLADEEYKKLQQEKNVEAILLNQNKDEKESTLLASASSSKKKNKKETFTFHSRKRSHKKKKWKYEFQHKWHEFKKQFTDISSCYSWK